MKNQRVQKKRLCERYVISSHDQQILSQFIIPLRIKKVTFLQTNKIMNN